MASTYSGAYPQSPARIEIAEEQLFCTPNLMRAAEREIFRVTTSKRATAIHG
jgi:hypothetical protein